MDVLLASMAEGLGKEAVGVVLTGMGKDGAAGSAAIRGAGGLTIAQDEASSVVYGMPRVAAERRGRPRPAPGGIAEALAALHPARDRA